MKRRSGFTIIELIVVITVIAILAGVSIASYGSWRHRNAESAVKSDLHQAASAMETARTFSNNAYPKELPASLAESNNVHLKLSIPSSTWPHYSNLSDVQNGVLLAQICQNLIDEGVGNGINAGGKTDPYVQDCGNWNHDSMQFTAWDTQVFTTPVSSTAFTDYAASVPPGDAWHPNEQSTIQNFYFAMHNRFLAQGGTYPITSFYDSWASPKNSGIPAEPLPPPDPPLTTSTTYCIQATYATFADLVWHVRQDGVPTEGSC